MVGYSEVGNCFRFCVQTVCQISEDRQIRTLSIWVTADQPFLHVNSRQVQIVAVRSVPPVCLRSETHKARQRIQSTDFNECLPRGKESSQAIDYFLTR
jgi:hypothetical protein